MTASIDTAGNITSLKGKRRARKPASRAAALMEQCREQLRVHMKRALPGIMDQVDDALFDLADKADTNQLQSTYFEAMRSVRLCREDIESRFVSELHVAMGRNSGAQKLPGSGGAAGSGTINLSLVEKDDMEESLAVKNIAGKIRNLCHQDLFALDRRVALLLDSPTLEGEDNPLGPHVLCSAARVAVDVIEANVEIRLLVLKLFDRHLTRAAEQFYPQINAWLVREGVLPTVDTAAPTHARGPHSHQRRPERARGAPQRSAEGRQGSGSSDAPPDGDSAAGWERYHGDGLQGAASRGGESAPMTDDLRAEQVLNILDQITRVGGLRDPGEDAGGREGFIGNLTSLQRDGSLAGSGNVVRELKASGVSHTDGLMIDVVAMMFDFILEDENIGDAMRVLIGRLQIPVLKVAILDKSFFARRSHPARSFINILAEYGARVDSDAPEHEPTLVRVQELVKRILDEFEAQIDIFSGAAEELNAIVAEDEDSAKRNAWASTKVAEERERRARARRIAEEQVEERLEQSQPTAAVACFLRDHWRHLLGERLYREGEQGESWREGLQTMDQLLWSVTPKHGSSDRDRLLGLLPLLLESIKSAMLELGMTAEARADCMRLFSQLHIAALRGEAADPAQESITTDDSETSDSTDSPPEIIDPEQPDSSLQTAVAAEPEFTSSLLKSAVERANEMVWTTAEERPQCQGMGATVVALKLDGDQLVCAHAGDSRLYRARGGELIQLSQDHTYRRECVAKGLVSEEDSASIANNMITRAVGGDATIQVEVNVHDTAVDDLFLCCSDGLTDMLDDVRVAEIVFAADDLQAMADALIAAANDAGGRDNISVGLLRVDKTLPESGSAGPCDYGDFLSTVVATDPGRRRAHNEDCISADASLGAMVLADGMGGHNAGEVASAMTVNLVLETLQQAAVTTTIKSEPGADDAEFDFASISAVFWGDQVPTMDNTALHEAVGEEVQSFVLSADQNLDIFDLDEEADASAGPGALDVDVIHDAARDPLLDQVLKLGCGVWVEFNDQESKRVRARLSWIAPERARYLFTDRLGQKVSEATPYGLAVEMRTGRMRILDDAPLFDRALSSLSRRLR